MAWSSYAYAASGWNAALVAFVNYETTFSIPYLSSPLRIPRGSVTSEALSGHEVIDGWRKVSLEQLGDPNGVTKFADLSTYVTAVHGGWAGADAEIALKTRDLDGSFVYYNCIAHFPEIGQDYSLNPMDSRFVDGLKLRFTLVNAYTPA